MAGNTLLLGLQRHWKQAILRGTAVWGIIWAIVEPTTFYFDSIKVLVQSHNLQIFLLTLLAGFVCGLTALRVRSEVSFILPTTNTQITVEFGDFFSAIGHKALAVNENFDTEIGKFVAQGSVHGQFIEKVMGGNSQVLANDISRSLGKVSLETVKRGTKTVHRYSIGTTAVLQYPPSKYFLFVLTNSNQVTGKALTDVSMMMTALDGLWSAVRNNANGEVVNLPLVGGGQSGIGLQPIHLLRLIVLSILFAVRKAPVTAHVRVVLLQSLYDQIDLDDFQKDWR